MTDPNVLAGLAALRAAREAWPWLVDLIEPGPVDRRRTRRLSPAAAVRHDRLVRAERRDQVANQRIGLMPIGAAPVPVNLAVLDVRRVALDAVIDQAWIVASELRRRGPMYAYHHQTGPADERGVAATGYLAIMLPQIPVALAGRVARELERVDAAIRRAAGVAPSWRTVHADCPACCQPTVRAEVSDPDPANWVIRCDNVECTCRGITCPCKQPDRDHRYGRHHWWAGRDWAAAHGPMAAVIQRGNAGVWQADGDWYGRAGDIADELGVPVRRVRDWLARSLDAGDRLHGTINQYKHGGVRWARFTDCAKIEWLTRNSARGRRRAI